MKNRQFHVQQMYWSVLVAFHPLLIHIFTYLIWQAIVSQLSYTLCLSNRFAQSDFLQFFDNFLSSLFSLD